MRTINLIGFAVICCLAAVLVAERKTNVAIAAAKTPANNAKIPAWAKVSKEQIAEAKKLGVPVAFENSDGMKFVLVPAGQFMMGSTEKEKDGDKDEKPAHEVVISKPFHLGTFEVTCAQWKLVMGTLPKDAGDDPAAAVSGVSWEQCQTFIRKLREQGFGTFRLPTEAEWEYACRAGTDTPFYYGDINTDFGKYADLADQSIRELAWGSKDQYVDYELKDDRFNDGILHLSVGRRYEPNAWGLRCMIGNVAEWTRSVYKPYPYKAVERTNAAAGDVMVVRGGSWYDRPKHARASYRLDYPCWQRVYNVGFRVIIED